MTRNQTHKNNLKLRKHYHQCVSESDSGPNHWSEGWAWLPAGRISGSVTPAAHHPNQPQTWYKQLQIGARASCWITCSRLAGQSRSLTP